MVIWDSILHLGENCTRTRARVCVCVCVCVIFFWLNRLVQVQINRMKPYKTQGKYLHLKCYFFKKGS